MVQKQNNFSRTLANDKKMGAYYTDREMCTRIGYLFSFPAEEVSVLEPSCGDLSALNAVLADKKESCSIFGVELNTTTYETLKEKGLCDFLLNADFLNGVKISHNAFGFCFANPPYGTDDLGTRLEQQFVEKIWGYMKPNAPMALVVPYYVATDKRFLKSYMSRFQPLMLYKFDDAIYKQFKQVVLVGIKRPSLGFFRADMETFLSSIDSLEKIPYLPNAPVEQPVYAVPSPSDKIEYFTSLLFNRKEAIEELYRSPLYNKGNDFFVPEFTGNTIGRPPVPLKKDLLYLLAVSGGGQGVVGSEQTCDLHLQRGVAKVVTEQIKCSEPGKEPTFKEKSYTQICLNIIENSGVITELS